MPPRILFGALSALSGIVLLSALCRVGAFGSDTASLFEEAANVVDLASSNVLFSDPSTEVCPWVILLYDSMCGHCRDFAPLFAAAADSYVARGIFVGSINCAAHELVCRDSNVSSVPTIFVGTPRLRTVAARVGAATSGDAAIAEAAQFHASGQHGGIVDSNPRHHWVVLDDNIAPDDKALIAAVERAVEHARVASRCLRAVRLLTLQKRMHMVGHHRIPARDFNVSMYPCFSDAAGALYIALRHEVPMAPSTPEHFQVLLEFLDAVQVALPTMRVGAILDALHTDRNLPLHTAKWHALLDEYLPVILDATETPTSLQDATSEPAVPQVRWNACRGSAPRYRGYTCGLWVLFHAMLSSAPGVAATATLLRIRSYVLAFFMCVECRVHFSQFQLPPPTASANEAILWLHHAHNDVNLRLRNATSSDPLVPKAPFPPVALCRDCWRGDSQISRFLRTFYSADSLTRNCPGPHVAAGVRTLPHNPERPILKTQPLNSAQQTVGSNRMLQPLQLAALAAVVALVLGATTWVARFMVGSTSTQWSKVHTL